MADIQNKIDERVKLIEQARAFLSEREETKTLSAEESAQFDAMMADADALKAEIDTLEAAQQEKADRFARLEAAEADMDRIKASGDVDRLLNAGSGIKLSQHNQLERHVSPQEALNVALQGWATHGHPRLMDEHQQSAANQAGLRFGFEGASPSVDIPILQRAPKSVDQLVQAQSVGTDSAGGYTVPEGFVNNLEKAMLEFGPMRQVADILRTASGNALPWPTVNDTGNAGALLAENTQDSEQDMTFGVMTLDAYKYTSKIVRVSVELLQDSAFNLGAELGSLLGERLGRIQNTHATTGTGSSQPNGIVTASALGKTAASATAITADEIIDLFHSVGRAYRGNSSFMAADSTVAAIRKLKDGDSQYLWQPGLQAGQPDRLLGVPLLVNDDMDAIATGKKTVLFGDMSKYKMREVLGVTLVRMVERYADYHQVGFVAITRFDGDLLNAGTGPVKHLIQA